MRFVCAHVRLHGPVGQDRTVLDSRRTQRPQLCSGYARMATLSHVNQEISLVAELAANAVTHGRVPGRGFRLRLGFRADPTLRIEVSDTRSEAVPPGAPQPPDPEAESGRGLLLVCAPASRWGTEHGPVPVKTVWAEMDLSSPISPDRGFHDPVDGSPVSLDA
ncbi:ATP-binding protein [Streptomyces sp. RerS4]|uniref:ATP-binding protein n=1 Tax=Streptomyces sp. RerS4 TaxID=2942449 RepID=UPI00201C9B8C|nr:ATP-binding protein [Streptomyces sp. RerS4]UQX04943.1 ATP-binding protein [Streptomyces sp. RerS4]